MALQDDQDGVISRQQLVEIHPGRSLVELDAMIRSNLRQRRWAPVCRGVYVDHTGPLTWRQQAWAAVLFHAPAALAGHSALHAWGVRGHEPRPGSPIYVCVDRTRSVERRMGTHVRQIARMETLCVMGAGIPRQRVEHALIDVASAHRHLDDCVAVLADAVQDRRTTAPRLLLALGARTRVRHRALMREVLGEVQTGVQSVLEHRFKVDVERAHGLPEALRQTRVLAGTKVTERDAEYAEFGVVVELDGRIAHEEPAKRWADVDRDISAAIVGQITIRPGWRHLLEPCALARSLSELLRSRGWAGHPTPCSADCAVLQSSSDCEPAQIG
jgi:hypothetical protein